MNRYWSRRFRSCLHEVKGLTPMTPLCLLPGRGLVCHGFRTLGLLILTWVLMALSVVEVRAGAALERLSVAPSEIALIGGRARQQVAVTGHFADGSVRDLTGEA